MYIFTIINCYFNHRMKTFLKTKAAYRNSNKLLGHSSVISMEKYLGDSCDYKILFKNASSIQNPSKFLKLLLFLPLICFKLM